MRGRVGERCHTIPYLEITYHTIPYHTMPYHDHTIPHGRMLEGWPNTRGALIPDHSIRETRKTKKKMHRAFVI